MSLQGTDGIDIIKDPTRRKYSFGKSKLIVLFVLLIIDQKDKINSNIKVSIKRFKICHILKDSLIIKREFIDEK